MEGRVVCLWDVTPGYLFEKVEIISMTAEHHILSEDTLRERKRTNKGVKQASERTTKC